MGRLTEKIEKCHLCTEKCPQAKLAHDIAKGRMYAINEMIRLQKELQEYKDLEEQGLLLRLPCKVGTTVYVVEDEYEDIYEPNSRYFYVAEYNFDTSMLDSFGKAVFLTKEEAEEALKKMRENSDDL